LLLLLASLAASQGIDLVAYPRSVPIGQSISITLHNNTPSTLWFGCSAPWAVFDGQNRCVYSPICPAVPWSLRPKGQVSWRWDQFGGMGPHLQLVPPGKYEARVGGDLRSNPLLRAPFTIENVTLIPAGLPRPGGTVTLILDSPPAAGLLYQVALGFYDGVIYLPNDRLLRLSTDELFLLSVWSRLPMFRNFVGRLDARGSAAAELDIPNSKHLVGLYVYAAFVTFHPSAPGGVFNHSAAKQILIQ